MFVRVRSNLPRTQSLLLGILWVVSLWATLALAQAVFNFSFHGERAAAEWLWRTRWAWPLASTVALVVFINPLAHRRWGQWTERAVVSLQVALGLIALTGFLTTWPRQTLLALGTTGIIVLLAAWVIVVPRRLAPPVPYEVLDRLSNNRDRLEVASARIKLQNDVRTTALQAVAGLAILATTVLAFQQLSDDRQQANATRALSLQGQASERFTRAVDQLGSHRREVQLGGIYGLEQIAQQAPDNRVAVSEVLVAFIHRRAPRPANPTTGRLRELRARARCPGSAYGPRTPTDCRG
jgi:hypothetical protein